MVKFPVCGFDSGVHHVLIGFQGWNQPFDEKAGKKLGAKDRSTLAKLFRMVESTYKQKKSVSHHNLSSVAFATDTWDSVKADAIAFIKRHIPLPKHQDTGAKLVIYGYSWGGDTAVELCHDLNKRNYSVHLLITVDAALGPFSRGTLTVRDIKIPANVRRNVNFIALNPDSKAGSQGLEHVAVDSKRTIVENKKILNVSHGNMDEHVLDDTKNLILDEIIGSH